MWIFRLHSWELCLSGSNQKFDRFFQFLSTIIDLWQTKYMPRMPNKHYWPSLSAGYGNLIQHKKQFTKLNAEYLPVLFLDPCRILCSYINNSNYFISILILWIFWFTQSPIHFSLLHYTQFNKEEEIISWMGYSRVLH